MYYLQDEKVGKIQTESGNWISASYKSNRYEQWKEKTSVPQDYDDNDDEDNENKSSKIKSHNCKFHYFLLKTCGWVLILGCKLA